MLSVNKVTGEFTIKFDYTKTIQEMLNDGTLKTKSEIKNYVLDCLFEDLGMNDEDTIKSHSTITIE